MQKWEMSEIFAKKMSGVFARSSPTFAEKSRLTKSKANLIGCKQTTHVRSRSIVRRRCMSQANCDKTESIVLSLSMVRFTERRKELHWLNHDQTSYEWGNNGGTVVRFTSNLHVHHIIFIWIFRVQTRHEVLLFFSTFFAGEDEKGCQILEPVAICKLSCAKVRAGRDEQSIRRFWLPLIMA